MRVRFLKLERTLSGSRDPASSSCHENDNHVTMMSTCRAKKKSTDFKIFFELRKKPDLNYFIERIIGQSVVTTVERRFAFSVKREKKISRHYTRWNSSVGAVYKEMDNFHCSMN